VRILTAAQMREADRFTIEDIGIPSLVLMENAGRQVVAAIEAAYEEQLAGRVAVLCGRGNNGGDGFVVARTLLQRGVDTAVFVIGSLGDVRGDARTNLDILGRLGLTVVEIGDEQSWELHFSEISQCTLIVDAILGTGLKAAVNGMLETVFADVNASDIPIVAVDLPSGLSADTPHLIGDCVSAAMTVTLAAPKLPLVLPPGETHAGDVVIADIGVPYEVVEGLEGPYVDLLTPEQLRVLIEPRAAESHKGDFGRVTVIAGSIGKTGAAMLSGMAALRSGAGLVTVATPASCLPVVASMAPEMMTEPLLESNGCVAAAAVDRVMELAHDVIACGPGLGRTREASAFVRALVDRATVPLVLDADALTLLAEEPGGLLGRDDRDVIITPHPGEMARLAGMTIDEVQANRLQVASDFRDHPSRVCGTEGTPDSDCDADRPGVHQSNRQSGNGDGGNRRRADRHGRRLAGAAARRGSRMPPRRLPAWRRRRSCRGGARPDRDDVDGSARSARRCGQRAAEPRRRSRPSK
jgi:NAD(P)H-hydrate epimerase